MKAKIEKLERLLKRRELTVAELGNLATIEGETRAAAEQRLEVLKGKVTVEVLSLPLPEGQHLDAETGKMTQEVHQLRQKLELIPGVRSRLETGLREIDENLVNAIPGLKSAARHEAALQVEALRSKWAGELRAVCGADVIRLRAALDAVVANSDARCWLEMFARWTFSGDAVTGARQLLRMVEVFQSGKAYHSLREMAAAAKPA